MAALWDPATGRYQLTAASAAARSLAVQLQPAEVRGPDEFDPALAAAIRGRPGALIELSSPLFYSNSKRIAEFTLRNRLPAISLFRVFPESGGRDRGPLPLMVKTQAQEAVVEVVPLCNGCKHPLDRLFFGKRGADHRWIF